MAERRSGLTRASSLGPIAEMVGHLGGSIERIFADVDLPLEVLDHPDAILPLREQFRLLERASRVTGDGIFGARLGMAARAPSLSAYGAWVCRGRYLGEAVERAAAGLGPMLQTATNLDLVVTGRIATWSIEFVDPECEGRRHNELLGLGYMMDLVRIYAGPNWRPSLIQCTATDKSVVQGLEGFYQTSLCARSSTTSFSFASSLLMSPHHEASLAAMEPPAQPAMPVEGDTLAVIKAVIELACIEGFPRLEWVAEKAGVSARTLQRVLASNGTSFLRLVEDALAPRAIGLLKQSDVSVTEIAHTLGYRDSAHFTRAFRRWTGQTPSAARAAIQI